MYELSHDQPFLCCTQRIEDPNYVKLDIALTTEPRARAILTGAVCKTSLRRVIEAFIEQVALQLCASSGEPVTGSGDGNESDGYTLRTQPVSRLEPSPRWCKSHGRSSSSHRMWQVLRVNRKGLIPFHYAACSPSRRHACTLKPSATFTYRNKVQPALKTRCLPTHNPNPRSVPVGQLSFRTSLSVPFRP